MEIDSVPTALSWVGGSAVAAGFIWAMRHFFRTMISGQKATESVNTGELRIHAGYQALLTRYEEEIARLTGRVENIRLQCLEENRRLVQQCNDDKREMRQIIEALQDRVGTLEREGLVKDKKLAALKQAVGLGGED